MNNYFLLFKFLISNREFGPLRVQTKTIGCLSSTFLRPEDNSPSHISFTVRTHLTLKVVFKIITILLDIRDLSYGEWVSRYPRGLFRFVNFQRLYFGRNGD
jgi:hypothetical protein